jgi:hypothetical protein
MSQPVSQSQINKDKQRVCKLFGAIQQQHEQTNIEASMKGNNESCTKRVPKRTRYIFRQQLDGKRTSRKRYRNDTFLGTTDRVLPFGI